MTAGPEIHIRGAEVVVQQGSDRLTGAPLERVLETLARSSGDAAHFPVRPSGARIWVERADAVAMALELPPHARQVRWLAEGSSQPFGRRATYEDHFVSFPYVVLLLVFRGGALTGQQQLYYRTESLDAGEELLLPNLYNVAEGYDQRCWVCLQHVPALEEPTWSEKLRTVVDHVFAASWNRSSEIHEGNSYWTAQQSVDPRVASMKAWEEATRADRRMALTVPWKPAGTTASQELSSMLDRVVRPLRVANATQLAGIVAAAARSPRREAVPEQEELF